MREHGTLFLSHSEWLVFFKLSVGICRYLSLTLNLHQKLFISSLENLSSMLGGGTTKRRAPIGKCLLV